MLELFLIACNCRCKTVYIYLYSICDILTSGSMGYSVLCRHIINPIKVGSSSGQKQTSRSVANIMNVAARFIGDWAWHGITALRLDGDSSTTILSSHGEIISCHHSLFISGPCFYLVLSLIEHCCYLELCLGLWVNVTRE